MTNSASMSPFTAQRYELDGNHVYYLPARIFKQLEEPKPTLLVGTRGTGKTTLLKALSWDERLNNTWFSKSLSSAAFDKHYIGLYFKLPELQLKLLDKWLDSADDSDYAAIFSFYLDLCWLEALSPAIEHLEAARVINLSRRSEQLFGDALQKLLTDDLEGDSSGTAFRLVSEGSRDRVPDMLSEVHTLRRTVERFARRRADVADVMDVLPIGQVGSFGREVGRRLMAAIDQDTSGGGPTWSLRICMDEGEALNLRQQRVVNSMIRLAEWPVIYVIAYVSRPLDVTGTFLPQQTLQVADRQIYMLDDMTDRDFRLLAEGVINTRLRASGLRGDFRARKTLGSLDLNGLLLRILRDSEDDFASDLLKRARKRDPGQEPPAIYEEYLIERKPELNDAVKTGRARRKISSSSIRKQMVGAYLSICAELGSEPLYASSDMVLQISDNCMRDFLRQMDHIFSESGRTLEDFLASGVPIEIQNAGIKAAAQLKLTFFRERVVSEATQANQFVDILARVTQQIQTKGRNSEQLRSPERGIFSYRTRGGAGTAPSKNELFIRDAADGGFLKILESDESSELRFRVHASLAPHYGFSYRGAYYFAAQLSDMEIDEMRLTERTRAPRVLSSLVERITGRRTSRRTSDHPVIEGLEAE